MNWEQITNNWIRVSDTIKRTWGKLSEEDLAAIAGNRRLLSQLLQLRYGYAPALAETKVDDFAKRLS